MSEPITVIIDILTPVHIGDGSEYDPVDYILQDNKMVFYNPSVLSKVIHNLGDEEFRKFYDLCKTINIDSKVSLGRYTGFIKPYLDKAKTHSIPVSKAALNKFLDNKSSTPVSSLIKGGYEQLPYIPGSTVKGLLKTILLWKHYSDRKIKDINELPFGMDDPWRLIDVSDFQPATVSNFIDMPINLHNSLVNGERKVNPIPAPLELITTGSRFIGTVSFNERLYEFAKKGDDGFSKQVREFFPKALEYLALRKAVKEYGDKLFEKERQTFVTEKSFSKNTELSEPFNEWWKTQKLLLENDNYRLIKLGKHAGAISKMVYGGDDFYNGIRKVRIINPKDRKDFNENDTQTTVWLSSDGLPLGWAKIVIKPSQGRLEQTLEQRRQFLEGMKKPSFSEQTVEKTKETTVKREQKPEPELKEWEKKLAHRGKKIPGRS